MPIYGKPHLRRDNDLTDIVGLRTLVLSQLWQASRGDLTPLELDAEEPAPPAVSGGLLFIGKQTRREGGGLRTTWTFEGINGDGKSPTFRDRSNSIDYRFEPGFSEKSLLLLPNAQDLLDQFGGYVLDGRVIWPPTVPGEANTGTKKQTDSGKPNPLFGRETFFAVEGTYLFRYLSRDLPSQSGVGKIHTSGLPGKPPKDYTDRNWLKLPVSYQRRGPVHECLEGYWLSGAGGWPKEIYGLANATTERGLTTGSL